MRSRESQLDLSEESWGAFMVTDTNLELLREAIEGGHLPSLMDLKFEDSAIICALRTSFDLCCPRRMEKQHGRAAAAAAAGIRFPLPRSGQAWVERVVMVVDNRMENSLSLQKLLNLPAFSRVWEMCSVHSDLSSTFYSNTGFHVIADYILWTEGAAFLCTLDIADNIDDIDSTTVVQALGESGGGANLKTLRLKCQRSGFLDDVGDIYSAGGLARLIEIDISCRDWSTDGLGDLMNAVVQSEHKGASLRTLRMGWALPEAEEFGGVNHYIQEEFVEGIRDNRASEAQLAILAALRRGAFPCLRSMDLSIAHPNIRSGKAVSQALTDALKGGAPCVKTSRSVDLHGMSMKHVQEVEALLGEGAIVC